MEAFDAYKIYLALRLHFTTNYDAVKYNYTTKADYEKFRNKPEAYWFNKLAKKYEAPELINAFVAQFVAGKKWGGMHDKNFEECYKEWLKKTESISYIFEQELKTVASWWTNEPPTLYGLLECLHGPPGASIRAKCPYIFHMHLKKVISLETLVIVDKLTGFVVKSNDQVTDTIFWPKTTKLMAKYAPFLHYDSARCKGILLEHFPVRSSEVGQDLPQATA